MKTFNFIVLLMACVGFSSAQEPIFKGRVQSHIGDTVEFTFRSTEEAVYEVDFGNGSRMPVSVDSNLSRIKGAISGEELKVYGDASLLWTFGLWSLNSVGLRSVDVSAMTALTCLSLDKGEFSSIDLSQNVRLDQLTLGWNPNLASVDVSMLPELYLLNLSDMALKKVDLSQNKKLKILYIRDNPLEELDLRENPELWILGCSNCGLTELDLSQNPKLTEVVCNGNELTQLDVSAAKDLMYLDCKNNYLTIGTLPLFHPVLVTSYIYSPQKPLPMPDTVGGVDFSAGYDCEGFITRYTWRTEEGRTLIDGIDYTMENGITNFISTGLKVSGQIENDFFPDLTGEDACQTEFFITAEGHVANEARQLEGTRAWTSEGKICMESGQRVQAEVYNLNGQLLHSVALDGSAEWEAPVAGLYVVRMQAGSATVTHKVMVM